MAIELSELGATLKAIASAVMWPVHAI